VGIISKLKGSIEAKKQSYEALIAFGICLAIAAVCALVGVMMWIADFIGFIPTCFLFAGLFALAAGVVNFAIEAKDKDASRKLYSAKEEVKHDAAAITAPLKIAQQSVPGEAMPAIPIVLVGCLILLAYFSKSQDVGGALKPHGQF
jgi:hypothetical protein